MSRRRSTFRLTGEIAEGTRLLNERELLGDSKRVAAGHYVCALTDYREVDRTIALARVRAPS